MTTPSIPDTSTPPTYVVAAAAIVRDGRVLIDRRIAPLVADADGRWELPGGKIETTRGEQPYDAVMREIWEELQIRITPLRLLPHAETITYHDIDGNVLFHVVVMTYLCKIALTSESQEPLASSPSHSQIAWVNVADLHAQSGFYTHSLPGMIRWIYEALGFREDAGG